jgi:hypothetical protein
VSGEMLQSLYIEQLLLPQRRNEVQERARSVAKNPPTSHTAHAIGFSFPYLQGHIRPIITTLANIRKLASIR